MASLDEPASNAASAHRSQVEPLAALSESIEARTASSTPDITQLSLGHNPDIFTIVCFDDAFQLALDFSTIRTLLRVCKRARPILSSKVPRFLNWCQGAELCHPDGHLRIGLTPSDKIALSLHCDERDTASRSWLNIQAGKGNAAASYLLARILQADVARQRSMSWYKRKAMQQEIFHHLSTAANIKHAMAQLHLAECYLDGVGVGQDHAKASELYRRLADDGIPQAQVAIGRCYENGGCVEQSYETAIEWYSKAAEQGHEDGRLHIIFLRGWFSFIGHGVEQSDVDALSHWHEVSSKSADPVIKPIATHMVGWMYYLGRGTQQDRQRGVKAIRESKSIEFKLGENECLRACWSNIKSGSAASRKLFELCRLGSNRDWLCNHLMIVCQFLGFGTTENRKEAVGIFEQLANEGHSDSQFWVGVCYLCGCGVLTDNEKAFEWLGKSAHQGNPYGQLMVGVSYYNGRGTTQDYIKAAEWFQKSAEQGNQYGQNWLGNCYQNGWGVESDIDIAVFWFRKSADQGNQNGIRSLRELGRWP